MSVALQAFRLLFNWFISETTIAEVLQSFVRVLKNIHGKTPVLESLF